MVAFGVDGVIPISTNRLAYEYSNEYLIDLPADDVRHTAPDDFMESWYREESPVEKEDR